MLFSKWSFMDSSRTFSSVVKKCNWALKIINFQDNSILRNTDSSLCLFPFSLFNKVLFSHLFYSLPSIKKKGLELKKFGRLWKGLQFEHIFFSTDLWKPCFPSRMQRIMQRIKKRRENESKRHEAKWNLQDSKENRTKDLWKMKCDLEEKSVNISLYISWLLRMSCKNKTTLIFQHDTVEKEHWTEFRFVF